MDVQYVQHWGNDLIVVNAARVSFDKQSEWEVAGYTEEVDVDSRCVYEFPIYKLSSRDEKLVRYLAEHKHTSCFEHMGATLKLKVPIFIARQIQRHRTFSYNEISRRYVDSPPEFFWPDKWRKRADNLKQGSGGEHQEQAQWNHILRECANTALDAYDWAIKDGVAPEQARMVLPQNLYTEMYMSGNLRSWAHFLHLRLDSHAQKEVQDVAKMVKDILDPLFPVSMKALMDNQ